MRYTKVEQLQAEIGVVNGFLETLPEHSIIERMSWESRLEVLQTRLAEVAASPQAHPMEITFRGVPVEGMRSIDATFASKALGAFVDATNMVTASMVNDLKNAGRMPSTGRSLRIVDTAVGSFGFELELPPATVTDPQMSLYSSDSDPHIEAITTTLKLLHEAASDDEDAISELIAEIHPRAAAKIQSFAKVMADNGAFFAVNFRNQQVRFNSVEQVKHIVEAIGMAMSDTSEESETCAGVLIGVLSESRRFEARLAGNRVVEGKVDLAISNIGDFKRQWENQAAQITLHMIRVRNRTRYVLVDIEAPSSKSSFGTLSEDAQ